MPAEPSTEEEGKTLPTGGKTLMDVIVETVAKCSEEYDDIVHVQVIKLLLMTLTSKNCEVHGASLLLAVRSCFHIHLISKNPANKTTAKAALTQIMSVVFNRMEAKDIELLSTSNHHATAGSVELSVSPLVASAQGLTVNTKPDTTQDNETDVVEKPDTQEQVEPEKEGTETTKAASSKTPEVFPSVLHKDAFLIFRALCKLSMKGLQDETGGSPSDPIALQNK